MKVKDQSNTPLSPHIRQKLWYEGLFLAVLMANDQSGSADLVQGSTAKVEILEHMVQIPVETKVSSFWQRIHSMAIMKETLVSCVFLISCPFA